MQRLPERRMAAAMSEESIMPALRIYTSVRMPNALQIDTYFLATLFFELFYSDVFACPPDSYRLLPAE